MLIDAGRTLALRRQKGGYLASFVGPQSLFIDIMMNVGLIFWAANATGDEQLRDIALEHCRTTARYLVRPDGGTAHEGIFDVETGAVPAASDAPGLECRQHLVARPGLGHLRLHGGASTQRRGGVSGHARRCADCYLRRAPEGLVPPWDFDVPPDEPQLWDSSAGGHRGERSVGPLGADRRSGRGNALPHGRVDDSGNTLFRRVPARSRPEWEGILMHGVYHYHKGLGVDESVAWGDHFFVEALVKVAKR